MADYQIRVSADTKNAQTQLVKVDKAAEKATRARDIKINVPSTKDISKAYKNIASGAEDAANSIKQFYKVSKNIPGIGDKINDVEDFAKGVGKAAAATPGLVQGLKDSSAASDILVGSVRKANSGFMAMVTTLAKVGFSLYAIKEGVNLLKGAFSGFFNDTIGREIQLRETLLKTQTTLASTSKVFKNGMEITDPLEKIETLTSSVEENIRSIRQRSLELAGVTSGEVIEVFGMVAQQISSIGGGLKEAEDLAIQFAAALGTFGIPLYQARQEIGSILRGDITMDSYLAKSLGITNEDIAEAKQKTGGVVKFLEDRLKAAVAGQAIAAKGFAGVTSNIAEIGEEIKRNFGAGLLDPLLGGLTNIYELLFKISSQAFKAANAIGKALGNSLSNLGVLMGGAGIRNIDIGEELAAGIASSFESAFLIVSNAITAVMEPLKTVFAVIAQSITVVVGGLGELAKGFASLQIAKFQALVTALEAILPILNAVAASFAALLKVYGDLLKQPLVQYLAAIGVTMKIVEVAGVKLAVQLVAAGAAILAQWGTIKTFFIGFGIKVAAVFKGILVTVSSIFATIGTIILGFSKVLLAAIPGSEKLAASLQKLAIQMGAVSTGATAAGARVQAMGAQMSTVATGIGGVIMNFVKLNLIIFAVTAAIALLIDGFGRLKRAQEDQARARNAEAGLKRLTDGTYDLKKGLDAATKAKKEFDEAMVTAQQNKVKEQLNEVLSQINELEERTKDFNTAGGRAYRRTRMAPLRRREKELNKELNRLDYAQKKKNAKDIIKLESDMRRNLEKEVKELRRQFADDEFRFRQRLERARITRFRAESDLEIQRLNSRMNERLKGEEGASRIFLESLNDYLKTKKSGEAEIAARQKELQLSLASLQKEIADYKYNTEKKIAKLQKEMGEYQKKVADYRAERARQAEQARGAGGALVELIADTESFGGNYGAYNRGGRDGGKTAIDPGIDDNLPKRRIRDIMADQAAGTLHAVGKYQIIGSTMRGLMSGAYGATGVSADDVFSPENQDKLFQALVRNRIVAEDVEATMAGLRQEWVGLTKVADEDLRPAVEELLKSGNALTVATPLTAPTAPEAPDLDNLGDVDPAKITASLSQMRAVLKETTDLQNQLTSAQTAEKLKNIAESMFPRENLEPLRDALARAKAQISATAAAGKQLTQSAQAELVAKIQIVRAEKERDQALQGLRETAEKEGMAAENLLAAENAIKDATAAKIQNLKDVLALRRQILGVTEAQVLMDNMQNQMLQLQEQTEDNMLRMRLEMEGFNQAEIDAELQKLAIRRQMDRAIDGMDKVEDAEAIAQLRNGYAELAKSIDKAAKVQMEMRNPLRQLMTQWKKDLSDINGMYAQMAQIIQSQLATAMSNAITGVLDGTSTVREAFASMFKSIGKAFIDMATQMIAKALVMRVLGLFLPGAGAGASAVGSGAYGNMSVAGPSFFSGGMIPRYAQGAYVNSATPAMIGEGGTPEYVIPENKMASSMARYAQGMRGKGVVEGADINFGSSNRSQAQPTALGDASRRFNPGNRTNNINNYGTDASGADNFSINITGEQLVFNEKNYVNQDQLPSIISQASKQGEARTLRKLRMSQTTRTRTGF